MVTGKNQAIRDFMSRGYGLIEASMLGLYTEVVPEMTRRVELLEALLFALVEHIEDPSQLDEMDHEMDQIDREAIN
ncbi:MAG TPA: hypothetical protein VJ044_09595 [Candidatus Hodarchaeales archaeon]|nr:hypothetical protein [Candidatus Hodarchaeales archaeon]